MINKKRKIVVAVSGGFDPVHIGHVNLFREAKKLGDELVVILNRDSFLREKKGYVFMCENERKKILESIKYVDKVIYAVDRDLTVCRTLAKLRPGIFANGGDRTDENVPELDLCATLGITPVFNVGGKKVQSSSYLVMDKKNHDKR